MFKEISVSQAKDRKYELEDSLYQLIKGFEQDTGVEVHEVDIDRLDCVDISGKQTTTIGWVKIDVKLK